MKITTTEPSPSSLAMLKALQQAVTNCLERKQKLGSTRWFGRMAARFESVAKLIKTRVESG